MKPDDFWTAIGELGASMLIAARLRDERPAVLLDEAERWLFALRGGTSIPPAPNARSETNSLRADALDFPPPTATGRLIEVVVNREDEVAELMLRVAHSDGGVAAVLRGPSWPTGGGLVEFEHDVASVWELRALLRALRQRVCELRTVVVLAERAADHADCEVLDVTAAELGVTVHLVHRARQET